MPVVMEKTGKAGNSKLKPLWHDTDDDLPDEEGVALRRTKADPVEGEAYRERLARNFEMAYGPTPKWARLEERDKRKNRKRKENEEKEDGERMTAEESKRLLSLGRLEVVRVENLNSKRDEGAIIRSVDFHPSSAVGLVAGDGVVSLYQVNGSSNPLIQAVTFENFPIRKAQFSGGGDEVYVTSGLMSHFHCYDMRSGKTRQVKPNQLNKHETVRNLVPSPDDKFLLVVGHETLYLLAKSSKELVQTWSVNGEIKGAAFSGDGKEVFVQDATGTVYCFRLEGKSSFRCVEKFNGEASFDGTSLAVSDNYIACGSSSGYVSIFGRNQDMTEKAANNVVVSAEYRTPLAELKNIVTSISALKINCAEEILAMGSVDRDNAIRLVHLPTHKVFANFPAPNANYGRCNSIAFSPNSGYLAMGSNRGCAYLFRLKHYSSY